MAPSLAAAVKCDGPDFSRVDKNGRRVNDEEGMARDAEIVLRMHGATGAHMTRFWNGCLQTFVKGPDGKDVMKFYDPYSYTEVALN